MPYPLVSGARVALGVILGMMLLALFAVAFAGTTFIDGEKVETCQGSTCSPGSDNGGSGVGIGIGVGVGGSGGQGGSATIVNAPVNSLTASPVATNRTTVTASPKASASSSAKSNSNSRSSSRSSATGGNATATGGQASANASNGNQTTSVTVAAPRASDLGRLVPDVMAPGLATGGDDVCLGSMSGGLGLSGIGAMFGLTLVDEHCQTIKAVKLLTAMGRPGAAILRACMDDKMRDALGDECPERSVEAQSSNSSTFTP